MLYKIKKESNNTEYTHIKAFIFGEKIKGKGREYWLFVNPVKISDNFVTGYGDSVYKTVVHFSKRLTDKQFDLAWDKAQAYIYDFIAKLEIENGFIVDLDPINEWDI